MSFAQPYRIDGDDFGLQAENIDSMFEDLYKKLDRSLPGGNLGDIIYVAVAGVLSGLAVGAAHTVLKSNGIIPSWAQVDLTLDVLGDLPYANFVQASAASKLLGRGSAAGAGDWQEIILGTNLSMSGTTLNATGGGSSGTWSVLTNGDVADPEILFSSGDAIMVLTP